MTFAQANNLKSGDVIVVPEGIFNLVAHYVVYRGVDFNGTEQYMENINGHGVRYITGEQFISDYPVAKRIRRFTGSDCERQLAIERGDALIGRPYHLVRFNCEDYANHIQYNKAYSKQTKSIISAVASFLFAGMATVILSGAARGRRLKH
ncbi:MAG: hypothetical protein V4635_05765 [Bacteroidota bacterium]